MFRVLPSLPNAAVLSLATLLYQCVAFEVHLSHVTTVYLPHTVATDGPHYSFDVNAVHSFVYDTSTSLIYAVGNDILHVVEVTGQPVTMRSVYGTQFTGVKLTDVGLCQEMVVVPYRQTWNITLGGVLIYQHYDRRTQRMELMQNITLRGQPAKTMVRRGCTAMVVIMENEPYIQGRQVVDPLGEVVLLRFPRGFENAPAVTTLNFTRFDNRFRELSEKGVRWPYRQTSFSRNLEPERGILSADETTAYICLQENNALAVVDLWQNNVTALYGFGTKSWMTSRLDPSDMDGGIHLNPWPVYGMYMPGAMALTHWAGRDYLITANEGSLTDYDIVPSFRELLRGNQFNDANLSPNVSSDLREALQDNSRLGRLMLSARDGLDDRGRHHSFYTFGSRSFSIWRLPNMELVYDSGSILEDMLAAVRPDLFNAGMTNVSHKVFQDTDSCSDDRGPEPESVAIGQLEDRLLIFVGSECPGTIAAFSLSDVTQPRFETYYTNGIPKIGGSSWQQLYQDRQLHAVDPECIRFYNSDESPTGFPVLMVAGSVSGTVSLIRVHVTNDVTRLLPSGSLLLLPVVLLTFWTASDS